MYYNEKEQLFYQSKKGDHIMSFLQKVCKAAKTGEFNEMTKEEMLIINAFAENHGDGMPLFAGEQRLTPGLVRNVLNILYESRVYYFRMGDIGKDFPEIWLEMENLGRRGTRRLCTSIEADTEYVSPVTGKPEEIVFRIKREEF